MNARAEDAATKILAQAFATEVLAENAAEQKYPTLDAMWDRVTVLAKESQP